MRIRGNVAVAVAAVWFGSVGVCAAQAPAAQTAAAPAAKGNIEAGKAAYDKYLCWTCHNPAAHGGAGPRLGPGPIALPAFIRYVRKPTGVMPPFTEKVMTDQELGDIHAFLASLPPAVDAAKIPLLQDSQK